MIQDLKEMLPYFKRDMIKPEHQYSGVANWVFTFSD